MKLILISYPEFFPDEHRVIKSMFDVGLECFHLRKPAFTKEEMKRFIENLPEQFHSKIVFHSHHDLINEYKLMGIHLPLSHTTPNGNSNPQFYFSGINGKWNKKITTSFSFHSINEAKEFSQKFDYAFLSPVFDSISKAGYKSNLNVSDLKDFLDNDKRTFIALGGIEKDKIKLLKETGFSGVALLGAIWKSGSPVENFIQIKNLCQKEDLVH